MAGDRHSLAPSSTEQAPARAVDVPPPGLAARTVAWAGVLAALCTGLGEWGWALLFEQGPAVRPLGWLVGQPLVLAPHLLVGVLLGWLAALVHAGWRRQVLDVVRPGERLRTLLALEQPAAARAAALLLGLLVCGALALLAVWPVLAQLPQHVYSPFYRAASALTLVGAAAGATVLLAPVAAWPLAALLRRLQVTVHRLLAALAALAVGGALAGVLLWHERLAHLPLGWGAWGVGWLLLLLVFSRLLHRHARRQGRPRGLLAPLPAALSWLALLLATCAACLAAGEQPHARRLALRRTTVAAALLQKLQHAADVDGDGVSGLLGGGDCRPWDSAVHPGAKEIPGNGVDEDCWGGDMPLASVTEGGLRRCPLPADVPPARNLLLITVDALRADRMGLYGHSRPTTPQLDRLAAESVVLEQFYSPSPCTRWALPMMQVSRYPSVIDWDRRRWPHHVPPQEHTLAELLDEEGLTTAAVWVFRATFGLRQGFDRWERFRRPETSVRAPELTDRAITTLEELSAADERFYLWVHYYDPHEPYRRHRQADLPDFGGRPLDRYDEEIALVDREIGRLIAHLDQLGLREQTAVLVSADHGEEFGEHGGRGHWGHLYEELIRIPFILRYPPLGSRKVAQPASLMDLLPTFLDLLGAEAPAELRSVGRSLIPDLLGRPPAQPVPVFASLTFFPKDSQRGRAVILGTDKLIYDPTSGLTELFDLRADPRERRDLSEQRPDQVHHLLGLLLPWMGAWSPEGERTAARGGR